MKGRVLAAAALLVTSPLFGRQAYAETIDCSAFQKQDYGYMVTKTTRILTSSLDVTVPQKMPIRRGQKAATVHGTNLADLIDRRCPEGGAKQ